jgi:hypothetical protein
MPAASTMRSGNGDSIIRAYVKQTQSSFCLNVARMSRIPSQRLHAALENSYLQEDPLSAARSSSPTAVLHADEGDCNVGQTVHNRAAVFHNSTPNI